MITVVMHGLKHYMCKGNFEWDKKNTNFGEQAHYLHISDILCLKLFFVSEVTP